MAIYMMTCELDFMALYLETGKLKGGDDRFFLLVAVKTKLVRKPKCVA